VGGIALGAPAAASAKFSVFPSTQQFTRPAGSLIAASFKVGLTGERGAQFVIALRDVRQDPSGAFVFQPPTRSQFSASSWVAVIPRRFSGTPDRSQPVNFVVRIPRNASPGDHITSINVIRLPKKKSVKTTGGVTTGVGIKAALAMRLTIRIPGALRQDVAMSSVDIPSIIGGAPVVAQVSLTNNGNTYIDFKKHPGALTINDGDKVKAKLPYVGLLYPGETRTFRVRWESPPLLGHFDARSSVDLGPKRTVSKSSSFWVLPWRQAGALLLIVLAAIVIATGRRNQRRRREKEKAASG
jgi:hypothetical protein